MRVSCTVNGERRQADDVWPGESLLYVLRERLGLPGAKNACEQGECGSCTVYLDGTAVCALGLALHPERGRVGACIGSAGPTPIRAEEAERFVQGVREEDGLWESRAAIPEAALRRFGELAAGAARPIDDVRGTAEYRRHSVGVLARRALGWAWEEYRGVRGAA